VSVEDFSAEQSDEDDHDTTTESDSQAPTEVSSDDEILGDQQLRSEVSLLTSGRLGC
jgi:hypothetical protein